LTTNAINTTTNKEIRKVMTRLCHVNDIDEGASKGFEIGDKKLFAVKKDAVIYVYENRCPHLGIELEWLENQFLDSEGALIQCSTHGALFLIEDGNCISGPVPANNSGKLIPSFRPTRSTLKAMLWRINTQN
jgi:nitrite reductase/ring-hydroxylating ferredoxin subunit